MANLKTSRKTSLSRRSAINLSLGALAVAAGGFVYLGLSSTSIAQTAPMSAGPNAMIVNTEHENIKGDANAPVTIIEYSSMTCPHCANHHMNTMPELTEKYIKTGKVRYIIREFPLDRIALAAAALARCAGPDKYFPFITVMYKQQDKWARGPGSPLPRLFKMAQQAGFTKETFNACMSNKKVTDYIEKTALDGHQKFGVKATPTLFVNGKMLESGNSLADIEKAMAPYL